MRLVQCYEDEYTLGRNLMGNMEESPTSDMKISVITNSGYVMNELLRKTDLGNVSGGYLSRKRNPRDIRIFLVRRGTTDSLWMCDTAGEQPEGWAEHYLSYVKQRLQE